MDNQTSDKFQFKRGLIVGAFNPFHEGHEYLLQKAQEFCELTDVYVGNKKRNHRLPRNVRVGSVRSIIEHNKWEDRFRVIGAGRHLDLDGEKYSVFVSGSDLLNAVNSDIKKTQVTYENYFSSFSKILVINRGEMPLVKEARDKLIGRVNLIDVPGFSDISGSKIRQAYRDGKDISGMVSKNTWGIIKDHVYVFGD